MSPIRVTVDLGELAELAHGFIKIAIKNGLEIDDAESALDLRERLHDFYLGTGEALAMARILDSYLTRARSGWTRELQNDMKQLRQLHAAVWKGDVRSITPGAYNVPPRGTAGLMGIFGGRK
jgi:hypothetical protein